MSNWTFVTSKQVWMDRSLSIEAKAIWHILSAWRDHKTGKAHPKMWTLQKVSGMGRPRVRKAVAELLKAGAIARETLPWRTPTGIAGSKHVYTVSKLSDWVGRDVYQPPESEILSRQVPDASGSGQVRNGPPISKPSTINKPSTDNNPSSAAALPQPDFRLTESEIENLLEGSGIESGGAAHVLDRLESMSWLEPRTKRPFRSRPQLEAFAVRLGQRQAEARTGR